MDLQSFLSANLSTAAFLNTVFQATYQRITGQPGVTNLRHRVQTILEAITTENFGDVDNTRHILVVNAPRLPSNSAPADAFAYLERTLVPSAFDFVTLSVERTADVALFTVVANSTTVEIPPFAVPLAALHGIPVATTAPDSMLFHADAAALCPHLPWPGLPVAPAAAVAPAAIAIAPPSHIAGSPAAPMAVPPMAPSLDPAGPVNAGAAAPVPLPPAAPWPTAPPPPGIYLTNEQFDRLIAQRAPAAAPVTEPLVQISEATQAKYKDTRRTRDFFENQSKYTELYSSAPTPTLDSAASRLRVDLAPLYRHCPDRLPSKDQLHVVMTLTFTETSLSCCSGGHGKAIATHDELALALTCIASAVRLFFGDDQERCALADAISILQIRLTEFRARYVDIPVSVFVQRTIDAFQNLLHRETDMSIPVGSPIDVYLQQYFYLSRGDSLFLDYVSANTQAELQLLKSAVAVAGSAKASRPADPAKTKPKASSRSDPNSAWQDSSASPPAPPKLRQPLPACPDGTVATRTVPCFSWVNGTCADPKCSRAHGYNSAEPADNVAAFTSWVKANKTLRK